MTANGDCVTLECDAQGSLKNKDGAIEWMPAGQIGIVVADHIEGMTGYVGVIWFDQRWACSARQDGSWYLPHSYVRKVTVDE